MLIPLILAFTPNYVVPASVTLRSLLWATPKEVCYDVICLVGYEPDEKLLNLLSLIDDGTGRLRFRFMNLSEKLKDAYYDPTYTAAANYRLVIAEELPEYNRAMYMDCDIVVRQDVSQLFKNIDLEGYYMAGVVEASSDWQIHNYTKLGLRFKEYINSGFLIMNLELMRQDALSNKFVSILQTEALEFPDQDAINIVCQGKLKFLPPVYNGIRSFFAHGDKGNFLRVYTLSDWKRIRRKGTIHYTGGKPWKDYTIYFEEWYRVYETLPNALKNTMEVPSNLRRKARLLCLPGVRRLLEFILDIKYFFSR